MRLEAGDLSCRAEPHGAVDFLVLGPPTSFEPYRQASRPSNFPPQRQLALKPLRGRAFQNPPNKLRAGHGADPVATRLGGHAGNSLSRSTEVHGRRPGRRAAEGRRRFN